MIGRLPLLLVAALGLAACDVPYGSGTEAPTLKDPFMGTEEEPAVAVEVIVNGEAVEPTALAELESRYGIQAQQGSYWYDGLCGAWGLEGQGTSGFMPAGLRLGGSLQPHASGGDTNVFINGRELPQTDLAALQQLGPVPQGRYWLDATGNWGYEGGPVQGNIVAAAHNSQSQQQQDGDGQASGGDSFYHNPYTETTISTSGGSGYIMGDGFSVSW